MSDLPPSDIPLSPSIPSPKNTQTPAGPSIKFREPKTFITETQDIIKKLEVLLSSKVLCYYTPEGNSINQSHPDIFLNQLLTIGKQPTISLVVISNGGDSSASLRIAHTLREYCDNLNILVPSRCASAATVLALSADKIVMTPTGYLTAIDTSLVHNINPKGADGRPVAVAVDQVKRLIKFLNEEGPAITENQKEGSYRTLFKYIHPLAIAEIDRISSRTILVASMMMKMHPKSFKDDRQITWIAEHLYNDYPEHGFPILFQEALDMGLPVVKADDRLSGLLRELTNHYDATTNSVTTHFGDTRYHLNGYTNLVESASMRTAWRSNYDKFLSPITKLWLTENNLSSWVNIIAPVPPEEKIKIQPLNFAGQKTKSDKPEEGEPAN